MSKIWHSGQEIAHKMDDCSKTKEQLEKCLNGCQASQRGCCKRSKVIELERVNLGLGGNRTQGLQNVQQAHTPNVDLANVLRHVLEACTEAYVGNLSVVVIRGVAIRRVVICIPAKCPLCLAMWVIVAGRRKKKKMQRKKNGDGNERTHLGIWHLCFHNH